MYRFRSRTINKHFLFVTSFFCKLAFKSPSHHNTVDTLKSATSCLQLSLNINGAIGRLYLFPFRQRLWTPLFCNMPCAYLFVSNWFIDCRHTLGICEGTLCTHQEVLAYTWSCSCRNNLQNYFLSPKIASISRACWLALSLSVFSFHLQQAFQESLDNMKGIFVVFHLSLASDKTDKTRAVVAQWFSFFLFYAWNSWENSHFVGSIMNFRHQFGKLWQKAVCQCVIVHLLWRRSPSVECVMRAVELLYVLLNRQRICRF